MDYVHIAIVLITMLEIVLLLEPINIGILSRLQHQVIKNF